MLLQTVQPSMELPTDYSHISLKCKWLIPTTYCTNMRSKLSDLEIMCIS